jgi:hypothetical protein
VRGSCWLVAAGTEHGGEAHSVLNEIHAIATRVDGLMSSRAGDEIRGNPMLPPSQVRLERRPLPATLRRE